MTDIIFEDWLVEQDIPPLAGQHDQGVGP